ncbi:winged helix-turn-helix domain-containing protein [Streptomyces sp. NPDC088788]|uniref:helix-turn-helix domain-containing protein n=1 Tax=Streptomyces sp. NPDC088788 TaxID=3365898 RepID=UPI00382F99B8
MAQGLNAEGAENSSLEGSWRLCRCPATSSSVLERELLKGPVAHGWPDQPWTLSRIKPLIGRRFPKSHTVRVIAALLRRHGWTRQVSVPQAIERGEAAVPRWMKGPGPRSKDRGGSRRLASLRGRSPIFHGAADHTHLVPPGGRPGSPRPEPFVTRCRWRSWRAMTPVNRRGSSSVPARTPGPRAQSSSYRDYRDLIQPAHQQLGDPSWSETTSLPTSRPACGATSPTATGSTSPNCRSAHRPQPGREHLVRPATHHYSQPRLR